MTKRKNKDRKPERLSPYSVGALLYSPANNETIAQAVVDGRYGERYSLALCLEDAISDMAVESAERIVVDTIQKIDHLAKRADFYLPKIFIRVREAGQVRKLYEELNDSARILTGFIFPKFSVDVMDEYIEEITKINKYNPNAEQRMPIYMMPIIESQDVVDFGTRRETLSRIKSRLDQVKEYVLNVRVGGNDFCKEFGVRRRIDQTIYDIGCVSNILSDIVTCFAKDYVVSAPVWEYFNSTYEEWKSGMKKELEMDMVNGFLGKTVIHPKQIAVVNNALKVELSDYQDAKKIMALYKNETKYVEKSATGERMNECKTHIRWAEKILILAKLYGIKDSTKNRKIIPVMV